MTISAVIMSLFLESPIRRQLLHRISEKEFIEAQQVATDHPTLDAESNDRIEGNIEGNDVPNL